MNGVIAMVASRGGDAGGSVGLMRVKARGQIRTGESFSVRPWKLAVGACSTARAFQAHERSNQRWQRGRSGWGSLVVHLGRDGAMACRGGCVVWAGSCLHLILIVGSPRDPPTGRELGLPLTMGEGEGGGGRAKA